MLVKTCPSCATEFSTRLERQQCCSRSCARKREAKIYGPRNWKGGVNKHTAGYLKAKAPDGHPYADKHGYVMQHRLVMEQLVGRFLTPSERVHHKNGQRDDNRPENLELWTVQKKDPAGQRVSDVVTDLFSRLSRREQWEVLERLGALDVD